MQAWKASFISRDPPPSPVITSGHICGFWTLVLCSISLGTVTRTKASTCQPQSRDRFSVKRTHSPLMEPNTLFHNLNNFITVERNAHWFCYYKDFFLLPEYATSYSIFTPSEDIHILFLLESHFSGCMCSLMSSFLSFSFFWNLTCLISTSLVAVM